MDQIQQLLCLSVTNMGPGTVVLHSCVVMTKQHLWKKGPHGILNPIHGDPTDAEPFSVGPFSGGLPVKIDVGDTKSFYFPYHKDCFLKDDVARVGIHDTYGRTTWCSRKDIKKAHKRYHEDFYNDK